MEKNRNLK